MRNLTWPRLAASSATALAVACTVALAQPARRAITLDDLTRLRSVSDPQRSPDGKWVAYTVGTTDAEKDKRDSDIWMVSWDGTQQVQLTFTTDSSESSPRWSPDGRYLAFLASRGTEEEKKKGAQVWLLDRLGGEARKLTDLKGGVSDYSWSPDSARLVFVQDDIDPASEPEKMEGWKRKTTPPIVIDRYRFKQDRTGYLKRLYSHVWLYDIPSGKAEQLTKGGFDDTSPAWSPDGRRIAFVSERGPDPDRTNNSDVYVVDATPGAEPVKLTTFVGPDRGRPSWSPDGRWIAYIQGDEPKMSAYNLGTLAIVPAAGGTTKLLTQALDRNVSGPIVWAPDGKSLTFTVSDDRVVYVGRTTTDGGAVEKLTTGQRTVYSLDGGTDGALALIAGTATEPGEVCALENGQLRKLSTQNDALMAELQLATTEDFSSTSKDGTEVHSIIVKPAAYVAGRKYPLILYIHGGPNGQDQHSFSFDRQFFAANGYVVLSVNYRGSSGRGSAYQKAIFADWGDKEVVDLLGAVDQAIASGIADPDRLGIGGWSYGGILTDYTIATDPRFKAAVSGAGSALQLSMYGTDQYITQYDMEIGQPWKTQDTWLRISYPFFHADRIKTPTLFMGGDKDFNVPLIGGEQMYQALKSMNVETELVIYPGQYHGLTVPSYLRDRLERYLAWYDKHLKQGS
jgi:dipeptidyl aminopeptidase/acylaminoacyl peptidase